MTTRRGADGTPMPVLLAAPPPSPHRIDFVSLRQHLGAFPGFRGVGRDTVSLATSAAVGGAALAERSLDLRAALGRLAAWARASPAESSAAAAGYAASSAESARVEWLLRGVVDAAPGGNGRGEAVRPSVLVGPERTGVAEKKLKPSGKVPLPKPAPAPSPANGASDHPLPRTGDGSSGLKTYHAVRVGRSIRSCIFLHWPDAEHHILDFPGAEYESFNDIDDAVVFARRGTEECINSKEQKIAAKYAAVAEKRGGGEGCDALEDFPENEHLDGGGGEVDADAALAANCNKEDIEIELQDIPGARLSPTEKVTKPALATAMTANAVGARKRKWPTINLESSYERCVGVTEDKDTVKATAAAKVDRRVEETDASEDFPEVIEGDGKEDRGEVNVNDALSAGSEEESVKAPTAKKTKRASRLGSGGDGCEDKNKGGCEKEEESNDDKSKSGEALAERETGLHDKIHEKLQQLEDFEVQVSDDIDDDGATGRHLSESWYAMLDRLTAYKRKKGSFNIPPEDEQNLDLRWWLARQSSEIRSSRTFRGAFIDFRTGNPSPILAEKARCLEEIGYELKKTKGEVVKNTRAPTITQKWCDMLDRLRAHKERSGSFKIDVDDADNTDLRKWLNTQVSMLLRSRMSDGGFVNRQTGKPSTTMAEKARRLEALGYELQEGKEAKKCSLASLQQWKEMYNKLAAYKEKTGSVHIRCDDEANTSLRLWFNRQVATIREEIEKIECSDDSSTGEDEGAVNLPPDLEERARLLEELYENVRKRPRSIYHSTRFGEMLGRYLQYKAEHGGADPPSVSPDPDIAAVYRWVKWQKDEYAKLKDGEESKLSAKNMQRLVLAGFDFKPKKGKTTSWADRMEQFRAFKAEHGHLIIPVGHPVLGNFARQKRREYNKLMAGAGSGKLTLPKRLKDLEELGFVFGMGRKTHRSESKSWEERFEELLLFKELNGHCVVPKTHPPLGGWVRRQRSEYVNIKKGLPSKLTPERVVRLSDIGFVWDATGWGRGGREGFG